MNGLKLAQVTTFSGAESSRTQVKQKQSYEPYESVHAHLLDEARPNYDLEQTHEKESKKAQLAKAFKEKYIQAKAKLTQLSQSGTLKKWFRNGTIVAMLPLAGMGIQRLHQLDEFYYATAGFYPYTALLQYLTHPDYRDTYYFYKAVDFIPRAENDRYKVHLILEGLINTPEGNVKTIQKLREVSSSVGDPKYQEVLKKLWNECGEAYQSPDQWKTFATLERKMAWQLTAYQLFNQGSKEP